MVLDAVKKRDVSVDILKFFGECKLNCNYSAPLWA